MIAPPRHHCAAYRAARQLWRIRQTLCIASLYAITITFAVFGLVSCAATIGN
jgi:hypothetical protein